MEILREEVKILKTKILTGNQVWNKYLEFQEGLGEGEVGGGGGFKPIRLGIRINVLEQHARVFPVTK